MPALSTLSGTKKTAIAIGGIAVGTAALAYYLYENRSGKKSKTCAKTVKSPKTVAAKVDDSECPSTSASETEDMPVQRGGRKNYRALRKDKDQAHTAESVQEVVQVQSVTTAQSPSADPDISSILNDPSAYANMSWSEQVQAVDDLASNLSSGCCLRHSSPERSPRDSGQPSPSEADSHQEVQQVMENQQKLKRTSKQTHRSSPSVHSEASMDSGRGGSTNGGVGSMSPVEESQEIEVPPFYEFECPQSIIGLIIGKKGATIQDLQTRSHAFIMVQPHHYKDGYKIVSIEGTRDQINTCLRMIRRRFPPSRFPDLNLHPVLPPPIPSPSSLVEYPKDMSLAEGCDVEVAISSIVDAKHFFVQQPTHPTFQFLHTLQETMNQVYGGQYSIPGLPRPIESTSIVVAASTGIGWFRACVMTPEEDEQVMIKFMDYGGYSTVHVNELKQIRSDLLGLPFQAVEVYLPNVDTKNEDDRMAAGETLDHFTQSRVCVGRVMGYHPIDRIPYLEVFAPQPDGSVLKISQKLVDEGLMVECKSDMLPPDSIMVDCIDDNAVEE